MVEVNIPATWITDFPWHNADRGMVQVVFFHPLYLVYPIFGFQDLKFLLLRLLFVLATEHTLLRIFFKYLASNFVSGRPA